MILVLLLAILAPIAARLVQLAVSREREYLADASSVEITRNPYGLERALLKISQDKEVLEVANRATQHLYIVNPIKAFEARAQGLFSTHPPIVDRINRLRALTGIAAPRSRAAGPRHARLSQEACAIVCDADGPSMTVMCSSRDSSVGRARD